MWRVLRRPRWVGYLALAVVFGVITSLLGLWQWTRHEERLERRALVEANYGGEAVPLDDVVPDDLEAWTTEQVLHVPSSAREEVVEAEHLGSVVEQSFTEMGADEARAASN